MHTVTRFYAKKLISEGLYAAASGIPSPRTASKSGEYSEIRNLTGLKSFVAALARQIAAEASKSQRK